MKTLTASEVARLLRVRVETVYRYARRRTLPAVRVGGTWRFDRDEIKVWMRNGGQGTPRRTPRTSRTDWRDDPILKVIGIISDGRLSRGIDRALYGKGS